MKILYIGNFYPLSVGEPEIAKALRKLGHEVEEFQELPNTIFQVDDKVAKGNYDFVLFAKFRVGGDVQCNAFLAKCRIPTVCWLFDLYWGYRRQEQILRDSKPCFCANIVFTTDGGNDDKWKLVKVNHHLLRQGIDEDVKMGTPTYDTKAQIVFVGSRGSWAGWKYRGTLIDWLKKTYGSRFEHLGENGEIRHEELNNLFATVKIIVCDSVNSPHYWSNRIYETIGRGGFAIHPRVIGLDKEFKEYEHFVPYDYGDFNGLKEKIDYFLTHDAEREKIRDAGYKFCHENYTYTKRCEELLRMLQEQKIIK